MDCIRRVIRSPRFRSHAKSAAVIVLALAFRSSIASAYVVPSGSMEPTVLIGDRIVGTKWSYGLRIPFTDIRITAPRAPHRGDIVVFPSPREPGVDLLKRAVAVGGDTIEVRGGRVILDGKPVPLEPAPGSAPGERLFFETLDGVRHLVREIPGRPSLRNMAPLKIPDDCFFAMGDNRDNSGDSRVFGPVPVASLRANGRRVLWSLDTEHAPYLRFGRFGAGLD